MIIPLNLLVSPLRQGHYVALTWVMVVLGVIVILLAAYWMLWVVVETYRAVASKSWPSAEGVVVSSDVKIKPWGGSHRFEPVVIYEYTVGGARYRAKRTKFLRGLARNEGLADEITSRYPDGKRVMVHYSPKSPKLAVLEPGVPNWFTVLFLLTWAAIPMFMGVLMIGRALSR